MSLSFSTTSLPTSVEVLSKLTDFKKAYESAKKEQVAAAEKNIDTLFEFIDSSMEEQGIVPLDIKVWMDDSGIVDAFILETRSLSKGTFRNDKGEFEEMRRSEGNPKEKVVSSYETSEPDIEIAIRGEDTALRTKPYSENTIENLFCQSLLAMFLTAEIRSLSNDRRVIGNVQRQAEKKTSIKHTFDAALKILDSGT